MVPREHRLLRHTIFCSWTYRYIWMKFELLQFDVFDTKLFRTNSSRRERWCYTSWQMRSFHKLFPSEASVDKCIKCSRKVCNIFWKTSLAESLPVNVLELEPAFLLKSDSHLPKKSFSFTSMKALQKWWKMLFISS